MKKIIFLLFLLLLGSNITYAYQVQARTHTERLDRGTQIELEMAEPVTSTNFTTGDMFSATLIQDAKINKTIVLPKGTLVRGSVGTIKQAKRLSRAAQMFLTFDHIVTPQGRQLPIRATICSDFKLTTDGAVTSGGNYKTAIVEDLEQATNFAKKGTNWGINTSGKLFPGAYIITVPIGAIGGSTFGVGYFLYESVADLIRKGDEVIINQGQKFKIILLENLDIPVN